MTALRAEPGKDIWLFGGGLLFRSLLDAGLVDTVEVGVDPGAPRRRDSAVSAAGPADEAEADEAPDLREDGHRRTGVRHRPARREGSVEEASIELVVYEALASS